MSFAVAIERRGFRILAEPDGAVLMRYGRERQALTKIKIPRKQALVTFVTVNVAVGLLHCFLQLSFQAIVPCNIIEFVADANLSVAIYSHPILRVWQIFGS